MEKLKNVVETMDLIFKTLPHFIDRTPNGEYVHHRKNYGEEGYFDNEELSLNVNVSHDGILYSYYYSDNDEDILFGDEIDLNVDKLITETELIIMFNEEFGEITKFKLKSIL